VHPRLPCILFAHLAESNIATQRTKRSGCSRLSSGPCDIPDVTVLLQF